MTSSVEKWTYPKYFKWKNYIWHEDDFMCAIGAFLHTINLKEYEINEFLSGELPFMNLKIFDDVMAYVKMLAIEVTDEEKRCNMLEDYCIAQCSYLTDEEWKQL